MWILRSVSRWGFSSHISMLSLVTVDELEQIGKESVGSVLDLVEDRCDSVEGVVGVFAGHDSVFVLVVAERLDISRLLCEAVVFGAPS